MSTTMLVTTSMLSVMMSGEGAHLDVCGVEVRGCLPAAHAKGEGPQVLATGGRSGVSDHSEHSLRSNEE